MFSDLLPSLSSLPELSSITSTAIGGFLSLVFLIWSNIVADCLSVIDDLFTCAFGSCGFNNSEVAITEFLFGSTLLSV